MDISGEMQAKMPPVNYYTAVLQVLISDTQRAFSVSEIAHAVRENHPLPASEGKAIRRALAQILQVPLATVKTERRGPFCIPVRVYQYRIF